MYFNVLMYILYICVFLILFKYRFYKAYKIISKILSWILTQIA